MNISIRNIEKSYGSGKRKKRILKGLDLDASGGDCIGIAGKNGCGKSTLLSVLAGVQKADSGSFSIDGHELLSRPKDLSKNVGFVPQASALMEELTAYDNLLMWYTNEEIGRQLDSGVLGLLGIGDFLRTRVRDLSGGMKKRLSIGCVMCTMPPVLLLDEPCAALDLECKENIIGYIKDYVKKGGIAVLTSHDPMELEICSSHYVMKDGRLTPYAYDGNVENLVASL